MGFRVLAAAGFIYICMIYMGAEGVTNTYSNVGTKRNGSRSLLLLLLLHSQQKEHRKPVERQPLIASLLRRPGQPQIVTKNKWGKAAGTHLRGRHGGCGVGCVVVGKTLREGGRGGGECMGGKREDASPPPPPPVKGLATTTTTTTNHHHQSPSYWPSIPSPPARCPP